LRASTILGAIMVQITDFLLKRWKDSILGIYKVSRKLGPYQVAIKVSKKKAVVDVKKLILDFNLTKGDLRGKALKQLVGAEWVAKMK